MENGRNGKCDFAIRGKVNWKGVGDEAFNGMSDAELLDYVQMLEAALFRIHNHFWYYGPVVTGPESVTMNDIGFDGAWKDIGLVTLSAALRMYKVHSTPFIPSAKPDKVERNI